MHPTKRTKGEKTNNKSYQSFGKTFVKILSRDSHVKNEPCGKMFNGTSDVVSTFISELYPQPEHSNQLLDSVSDKNTQNEPFPPLHATTQHLRLVWIMLMIEALYLPAKLSQLANS